MDRNTEKANVNFQMALLIKDLSNMINLMDKDDFRSRKGNTLDFSNKVDSKVKDFFNGKMNHHMKATIKMIKNMDSVNIWTLMEKCLRVTGKMEYEAEMELLRMKVAKYLKVNG